MKKSILLGTAASLLVLAACNSDETKKTDTPADTTKAPVTALVADPDPTDTIPAGGYAAYNSDMATADMIRKTITPDVDAALGNTPDLIAKDQRKFKYHAADLNTDGKNEYFVAPMPQTFFCGTGGCTAYLLDNQGNIITKFSVIRFPIALASTESNGWKDLVMESGGKSRIVKYKDGKYPANPSVEPEYKEATPAIGNILDIYNATYPVFSY